MKRIVLFKASLASGGAEHQIVILADLLRRKGYNVNIVTFSKAPDHYKTPRGVHRLVLGEGLSDKRKMICIWKFFLSLKREDVIISFGQRENIFCILPLLINMRPRLIAGERNVTYTPNRTDNILINYLYRRAKWVVPNSYTQGKYLINAKSYLKEKVKVITNYTDISVFNVKRPIVSTIPTICIFSRYDEQKNPLRFICAINKLKSQIGESFKIEWYGDIINKGETFEPLYLKSSSLIKELALEDVIELHDKVSNVQEIMQKSDAVCLPSLFEGFSNTLSEAICCGKPCLASNVSDNHVMVEDGVNGFLFDPLDENDIVRAFIRFLNTPENKRIQMGIISREKALNLFDAEIFVNQYIELIDDNNDKAGINK